MRENAVPGLPDLLLEIQEAHASVCAPGRSEPRKGAVPLKQMSGMSVLVLLLPGFRLRVVVTC